MGQLRPRDSLTLKRLVCYCQTTNVSTAPGTSRRMCCPTHCATYCAPCQPLSRAFSGWIRSSYPTLEAPPKTLTSHQEFTEQEGCRFGAKRGQLKRVKAILLELQGRNLALTVLYVPRSLDSGHVRTDLYQGRVRLRATCGTTRGFATLAKGF